MDIRHLRYFRAVAQELHFARAAERLHIEQSPLSRAIKELEDELGVRLFERTTRRTRLTRAGQILLEHVGRIFISIDQARDSVRSVANGFQSQLRVALSDGMQSSGFSSFLALCREQDPDVDIRLFEIPLYQQIKGLQDDLYDVGFSLSEEAADGLVAEMVWNEPLMVAVPARHPLLAYRHVPMAEVLRYPLVLGDPQACEGYTRQIDRLLKPIEQEPLVAETAASTDVMMALVAAGFALALVGSGQIIHCRQPGVVARPLAGGGAMLTTYMLRPDKAPSQALARFVERAVSLQAGLERLHARAAAHPSQIE